MRSNPGFLHGLPPPPPTDAIPALKLPPTAKFQDSVPEPAILYHHHWYQNSHHRYTRKITGDWHHVLLPIPLLRSTFQGISQVLPVRIFKIPTTTSAGVNWIQHYHHADFITLSTSSSETWNYDHQSVTTTDFHYGSVMSTYRQPSPTNDHQNPGIIDYWRCNTAGPNPIREVSPSPSYNQNNTKC